MTRRTGRAIQRVGAAIVALAIVSLATSLPTYGMDAPAAPPAAGSPAPADLSHLNFTATGALSARFVSPADNDAEPIPATAVVVATQRGAGVELLANGVPVNVKHIGKRTIDKKTGETRYFYYGVPLSAGPNTLTARPIGANGALGAAVTMTVYGPGDASTIRADFVQQIVADGKTVAPLNITVTDRYGHAAAPSQRVDVTILRGDVHFVDAPTEVAATSPGATPAPIVSASAASQADRVARLPLPVGGYVQLRLQPGTVAGPFEIEIHAGAASLRKQFYVEPFVRSAFVDGVVSIGAGSVPDAVDGDGTYVNGDAQRARAAIFASGAVGRSLLTFAYESQNRLSPLSSLGAYGSGDPNERPYLTYGDSSQVVSPYHSNDHLYVRVDRGESSAMWGQYTVKVGPNDVGSYQQLLSGAKADVALGRSGRAKVQAFTARNDQAFDSEILALTGLAVLVKPLHPDIVVGSDIVNLVTLDRQTGLVLSETPLLRDIDYTIDYATGILRFINIPLPYDANFNPQVISLQYEYQGPGVQSQTTGGELSYALSQDRKTTLLASYVNDATGTQNFDLSAQSLSRTWSTGSATFSHAASAGTLPSAGNLAQVGSAVVPGNGNAYSFTLANRTTRDALAVAYQATTAGYDDPFGGFSSPGTQAYRGSWTHGAQSTGALTASLSGERNAGIGSASTQADAAIGYVRSLGSHLVGSLGLTQHRQVVSASAGTTPAPSSSAVPLATTTQTQAQASLQYKAPKGLGAAVSENLTLSGSDVGSTQPSQTSVEASYTLPKQGRIFVRELWSDQPSATFANSTSNLNIASGSTRSTQFGIEQQLSPATTVSSEYVVDQTGSGLDVYDAVGADEKLKLGSHITSALQVQAANAVGTGAQGFTLLGGMLSYVASPQGMRSSIGYQDRTGANSGSTLSVALAGHLANDVSAVGFIQRAYGNGIAAIDDRVSIAVRPQNSDRLISLFDYSRTNGVLETGEAANVASFEELYRPTERLELAGRFAYKFDGGGAYAARTILWSERIRQKIGALDDIGFEVRTVHVPGAVAARQTELAVEAGRTLGRLARVAVGYNLSGSVDPTLLGQPQRHGVYVTFTTLIDRIFGWGKP